MIIDDVEALKSWMAKLLEPICDADPTALANYVVALVKKDKPENHLKELCADQLDVFLEKETTGFVDKLFRCLITKDYLESVDKDAKEISKVEGTFAAIKSEDKKEAVIAEGGRDGRRRQSPLRGRLDFSESRAHCGWRQEGRRSRDAERYAKNSDSYRERRDRHAGSSHGRSRSRSQDRERKWERDRRCKQDVEKREAEDSRPAPAPAAIHHCGPLAQCSSEEGIIPGCATVASFHLPDSTSESRSHYYFGHREGGPFIRSTAVKHRCNDCNEQGVCVRGNLSPFELSHDPLLACDITLPGTIPLPPPPSVPPSHAHKPPPAARMPTHPHFQLPPPGIFPVADNYDPDGYNPEVPSITPVPQNHQFIPRIQTLRPNLIGLTSGEVDVQKSSGGANIVIQTEPLVSAMPGNPARYRGEHECRKRSPGATDGAPCTNPCVDKQNYRHQHKPNFQKRGHYGNSKLEVRKIPRDLNNITELNRHFSKFGKITSIQVILGNDAETALIQYATNAEARRAISSTEAVLNNRFIKVYWHRDSGEQPSQLGQEAWGPSMPLGQKTANIGKTSMNTQVGHYSRLVVKGTAVSFGKMAKGLNAREAAKKKQESLKLQQDMMMKKKQEMLEMQIKCQKALLNKLEKLKGVEPEERAGVMKTLKELTEKISQLKEEMKLAPRVVLHTFQSKSKTDAQKELLDAELDFHKKLTSGEDTTDLRQKLNELQVEASRLGLIPEAFRRAAALRGRGRGVRGRGGLNRMVVDHRPRALAVLGVTGEEKDDLIAHFARFGEIMDLQEHKPSGIVMTFRTRAEAERAANQGAKFKDRPLRITWYKPKAASVPSVPEESSSKDERLCKSPLFPEEEEDEDEEDKYESRSWRR